MSGYNVTAWRDRHGEIWEQLGHSGAWSADGASDVYNTVEALRAGEGPLTAVDVDDVQALLAERELLAESIRNELAQLWADMSWARRDADGGCWSMRCENLAHRIVALSQVAGATSWVQIDVAVLLDGTYEKVLRGAGLTYPPIDWDRVREVQRRIDERSRR